MVTNHDRKSFGSHRKNSKSCSDDWHRWCFWSVFRHFGTHFAESFRMSKSSWVMDPTHSLEIPSCSAIDLVEIRQPSKISSWIWSIISGVVTVSGRPGRGASHVEKSPRLNRPPPRPSVWRWYTMVHVTLMFLSEWREFPSAPCFAGGRKTWKLASRCCWNRARRLTCFLSASVTRRDLQFGTWTGPSFQWHYRFRPTTSGNRSG